LLSSDLVSVSDIVVSDFSNFDANYQISFRTEINHEAAEPLENAQEIFTQSFELCKISTECAENVAPIIVLPDYEEIITEELIKYTDDDTILWKVNSLFQFSPGYTNRLSGRDVTQPLVYLKIWAVLFVS